MKNIITLILTICLGLVSLQAGGFSKKAEGMPQLIQKGPQKMWCAVCGMNLKMFYKTSHAVILKNGKKKQYCSIRCLAADMPNIKNKISKILVVDAKSGKLINVKKAYYVVGSKVKGTMSMVSKIAFGSLVDAKSFQKKYGGKIVDFDIAFLMAQKDLVKDSAMMAKKKKRMMYPMGKKIYKRMCKPIDVSSFKHINGLKAAIKIQHLCKPMREKELQAVALYLWDIKGGHSVKAHSAKMMNMKCQSGKCGSAMSAPLKGPDMTKQDKCPVCGMFVYKHPKWAAFIYYEKDQKMKYLAFDGVKDMMKFYFDPNKWGDYKDVKSHIIKMVVRDYYSLKPIRAETAYYVIGSNVIGPMGNELIPFKTKKEAQTFMQDHDGKKLVTFAQITPKEVYSLDE